MKLIVNRNEFTVMISHVSQAEKILQQLGKSISAWVIYADVSNPDISFGFRTDLEVEEVVSELSEIGFRPDKIFKDL